MYVFQSDTPLISPISQAIISFQEFFLNVKDLTRHLQAHDQPSKHFNAWTPLETGLQAHLNHAKGAVHKALCDNIDTRSALDAIRDLVTQSNIYIRDVSSTASATINALLLRNIALYITDILHVFGAINGPRGGIGFQIEGSGVDVSLLLHNIMFHTRI